MATVTVGTIGGAMTAAQLKTAMDAAVNADLTRQGSSNSRTYRCVDNLLLQGDTDAEGFTFICAPGKTVTFHGSAASPGVLRTSTYVDGVPFLPIRIVYEGETPFGEHDVTQDSQGFLRNCGMDVGRLEIVITGDTTSNYYGVPFLTVQKTVIRELVVSNQNQSGLCYTNFNLTHSQSSVRISSIRNSTIRVSSSFDFGFTGNAGWAFGEGGTQDVKLLSPNNSRVVGLAPKFSTSAGVIQLTDPNFSATTRIFRDSFIAPSRVAMYPTGNDSAVTEIERTVTYKPQAPNGSALSSVMARVLSTRVITGSAGVAAGATVLHTGSVNSNDTQVFRVWKGFNAGPTAGAYQPATKIIDDNVLTITYRKADLSEASVSLLGYEGPATALGTMAVDSAFAGTTSGAAAITGVTFTYTVLSNIVAVDITGAVTGQQIYNYWKHWTAQSAQMGATLVPIGLIAITNGQLVVTGTLTTSAAISAAGNVITVKTTGAITISSGGSILMPYVDSTADSYLSFEDVTTWTVYSNAGRTSQLGTGSVSDVYRFLFSSGTTYYLTLNVNGEDLLKTITPASSGGTRISLSSVALLSALIAKVNGLGTPLQSVSYVAPANSDIAAIKAKTDNLPAQPAAVGSAMTLTSVYDPAKTSAPTASQNASAMRTELATELSLLDVAVSSRLPTSGYIVPTAPPTVAQIRTELETMGSKLDKAMKAAQSAEDQTL